MPFEEQGINWAIGENFNSATSPPLHLKHHHEPTYDSTRFEQWLSYLKKHTVHITFILKAYLEVSLSEYQNPTAYFRYNSLRMVNKLV